jgi:hypothetical protein
MAEFLKSPEVKTNAVCMLKDKKGKFTKSKSLKHSVVRVEEMKKGKVICGAMRKLTYESDNILNASGPPANENMAQQETKYKKRKQEQEVHVLELNRNEF